MAGMSRTTMLVLLALGATLAGFALSTNARRMQDDPPTTADQGAAGPQRASLGWRETFGDPEEHLVFTVDSLEVTTRGWEATIGLENASSVPYELGGPSAAVTGMSFGLLLLASGDQAELERQNANGTLPPVRQAVRFEPELPPLLEPGSSWSGTMSAPGSLVADSWARVVFGPLVSVGSAPDGLEEHVAWITDRTYHLRP
jgi:hypothetical protein